MFIAGNGEQIELTATELRYLIAITRRLDGPIWDKTNDRIAAENMLYKLGLIQFKLERGRPSGARCVPYPTAIAAVQLVSRGLA